MQQMHLDRPVIIRSSGTAEPMPAISRQAGSADIDLRRVMSRLREK
ncbi:hypothetical protein JW998_01810 [candidate division KSB1 bacterium]|nr:hypothetical protein [candidate division KSB1 bacterium]